jgi:hypothetical protein
MSTKFLMVRKTNAHVTIHEHDRATGESKQVVRITNNLGIKRTECRRAYNHINAKYGRFIPVPKDIHNKGEFKEQIAL